MKIFDFHAHIYPTKISQRAVKSVSDFYNIEMDGDGTVDNLLSQGKDYDMVGYLVNSVAVDGAHVEIINNYIASECSKHSEFYGFGSMHAAYANKIDELERMVSLGLRGVKIHPDTQQYNMDDRRMDEVYDYLSQKELPILIHCGDYRYNFSHPKRLANILDNLSYSLLIKMFLNSLCVLAAGYKLSIFWSDERSNETASQSVFVPENALPYISSIDDLLFVSSAVSSFNSFILKRTSIICWSEIFARGSLQCFMTAFLSAR